MVTIVNSDPEIQSDVQFPQAAQGAALVVRSGGQINLEAGAKLFVGGADVTAAVATGGVAGVSAGFKLAQGEIALSGTNPTSVVTGLSTVTAFVATLKESAAPGDNTTTFSYTDSAGTVSLYAWKPTSVSNPTLIASTGTETVGWIAIGT